MNVHPWRLMGIPYTPEHAQPSLPPPPDTADMEQVTSDLRHLDDLNETIDRCHARLAAAHGELLHAHMERRLTPMRDEEWQINLDHENYLLERCRVLNQQLINATKRRERWLANNNIDTEVPIYAD